MWYSKSNFTALNIDCHFVFFGRYKSKIFCFWDLLICRKNIWGLIFDQWPNWFFIRIRTEGLCTKTGPLNCISYHFDQGFKYIYNPSLCTWTNQSVIWQYFSSITLLMFVMTSSEFWRMYNLQFKSWTDSTQHIEHTSWCFYRKCAIDDDQLAWIYFWHQR